MITYGHFVKPHFKINFCFHTKPRQSNCFNCSINSLNHYDRRSQMLPSFQFFKCFLMQICTLVVSGSTFFKEGYSSKFVGLKQLMLMVTIVTSDSDKLARIVCMSIRGVWQMVQLQLQPSQQQ